MPAARDAKEWATRGGLHGIGDSLYTPFSGTDGDDIDYDAYRALVRYCVGDLGHAMLWLTSGIAEWWSLTIDERKRLLEIAVEEARAVAPDTVIQACTSATSAKDCLELTQHAEAHGADICYLQTPPMEVHGGEGVQRFFQYIADRTDIALGLFNSRVVRLRARAGRGGEDRQRDPGGVRDEGRDDAVVAQQGGARARRPSSSSGSATSSSTRRAGCSRASSGPAQLGTSGYLYETPEKPDAHHLLEPRLGRSARGSHRVQPGDGHRPDQRRRSAAGSRATPAAPTTSPTGARRSATPPRCSGCRWATTRTRVPRRPSCRRRPRCRSEPRSRRPGLAQQPATRPTPTPPIVARQSLYRLVTR